LEKMRYGGGRVLYWSHAAGVTERRASVRSGDTAFELLPLTTPESHYPNIMFVDLGTHPRLISVEVLNAMLKPGIYLTDLARSSMPALVAEHLAITRLETGEVVWEIIDTMAAFAAYWNDENLLDCSTEALEAQHRSIRAIAEGWGNLRLNMFPIPPETIVTMLHRHLTTLDDLMALDMRGVEMQSDLSRADLAETYRIIRSTLEARRAETGRTPTNAASDDWPRGLFRFPG